MKIAVFDPNLPKFTEGVLAHWRANHEVKVERYYNPALVEWADVVWFDTCDNNLKSGTYPPDNPDFAGYDMHDMDLSNKKIIVRVIDIEAWYGHHNNADWNLVDDVIFIAPHIQKLVEKDIDFEATGTRIHSIPCGVDTDKFNFVPKPVGKKIAWVCEKWPTKGIDYMLQIMALLPKDYELHTIGGWNDRYEWEKAYQEDFIARNDIKFFDYAWVEDQNEWLADKDFILSTSKKEGFGYSIAEGMSKGLFPVIHRFYGCDDLWDINVWDTVDMAAEQISAIYDMQLRSRMSNRQYLFDKGYDLKTMLQRFDEVINA